MALLCSSPPLPWDPAWPSLDRARKGRQTSMLLDTFSCAGSLRILSCQVGATYHNKKGTNDNGKRAKLRKAVSTLNAAGRHRSRAQWTVHQGDNVRQVAMSSWHNYISRWPYDVAANLTLFVGTAEIAAGCEVEVGRYNKQGCAYQGCVRHTSCSIGGLASPGHF